MEASYTYGEKNLFINNRGFQGGIAFAETKAMVSLFNNIYEGNFAFEGGIAFV
jgi:hypothetical protein